jgi:hypothetical protein
MLAEGLAQHSVTVRDIPAVDRVMLPRHRLPGRRAARGVMRVGVNHLDMAMVPVEVAEKEPR